MTGGVKKMSSGAYLLMIHGSNYPIRINTPKDLIAVTLQSVDNVSLWSCGSLKYLVTEIQSMVIELCEDQKINSVGPKKATCTRNISKAQKSLRYIPNDRDALLVLIYELILEAEGMGRMYGFGLTNKFGDKIRGNPELNRMTIPRED
jgi:hypothetical protein